MSYDFSIDPNTNAIIRDSGMSVRLMVAQETAVFAAKERDKARLKVRELEARKAALLSRQTELNAIPEDPQRDVWCADYSPDLQGEVGTIEIPGEGERQVIIFPDHIEGADHQPARDGQLFQRPGLTGPQAYLAAAILPGWQKHKPTYRVGVITAVDYEAGTVDVTLDAETSSTQGLPIDPLDTTILTAVPVDYMDCHATVFQEDDRVVVRFADQDPAQPRVIGFESEPRPCEVLFGFSIRHILTRYLTPLAGHCPPATTYSDYTMRFHASDVTYAVPYWASTESLPGVRAVKTTSIADVLAHEFVHEVAFDFWPGDNGGIGREVKIGVPNSFAPDVNIPKDRQPYYTPFPSVEGECEKVMDNDFGRVGASGNERGWSGGAVWDGVVNNVPKAFSITPEGDEISVTYKYATSSVSGIYHYSIINQDAGNGDSAYYLNSHVTDTANPFGEWTYTITMADLVDVEFQGVIYEPVEFFHHLSGRERAWEESMTYVLDMILVKYQVKRDPPA